MKITFLGVGSAFSRRNAKSNLLIECGDVNVLIDCGCSGPPALQKCGLSLQDVTHILITHLHADHIGGLEEVAFMTRLVHQRKVTLLSTTSLLERLWQCSLRGGLEFIELMPSNETPQTLGDFFTFTPICAQEWVRIGANPGLRLYLHPTDHVKGMESYGLEVEEVPGGQAKRFFFSGDTKFDPTFIQSGVRTCGLVFHDCQLVDSGANNEFSVHASYQQLCQLPPEVRRHLWLYHYGDTRPLPDAKHDGFAGFVTDLQTFAL
jgi:ribonuclease BN (tRNA processing enzyme)